MSPVRIWVGCLFTPILMSMEIGFSYYSVGITVTGGFQIVLLFQKLRIANMAMLPAETGGSGGGNSGDSGGGSGRQPRQHLAPKSYEDILKFAIENTTEQEQMHEPMSEEVTSTYVWRMFPTSWDVATCSVL